MDLLEDLAGALAPLVTAAALVSGAIALLATRRPALALGVLLDLLVAAGLLRLVGDPSWQAVVTAAAVVALRHLISFGLRTGAPPGQGRSTDRSARSPSSGALADQLLRPAWRR